MRGYLSDIETLALIVACLCHDLDHRGTNNSFQHKSLMISTTEEPTTRSNTSLYLTHSLASVCVYRGNSANHINTCSLEREDNAFNQLNLTK